MPRRRGWGGFLEDLAGFDAEYFESRPRRPTRWILSSDCCWRWLEKLSRMLVFRPMRWRKRAPASSWGVFARLLDSGFGRFGRGGRVVGNRRRAEYHRQPRLVFLRLPRSVGDRGHGLLVVVGGGASGASESAVGESDVALAAGVNIVLSPAPTRGFDVAGMLSPSAAAAPSMRPPTGSCVPRVPRCCCSNGSAAHCATVTKCWPWCGFSGQSGRPVQWADGPEPGGPDGCAAERRTPMPESTSVTWTMSRRTARGTSLGDPIEARALGTVLGRGRPAQEPLLIGSVKSNLGHLESAAGIAGLAKAVLALDRGTIPATVGYETPNPHIPFAKLRLKVVDKHTEWPDQGRPRRVGVSAFGFGGTNAHLVLEQAPAPAVVEPGTPRPSARWWSPEVPGRIAATAEMLADWWQGPGAEVGLEQVAHTLNHHRGREGLFATVCARDRDQAVTGLAALRRGGRLPEWSVRIRGRAGLARCSSTRARARNGPEWAGACWSTSRRLPQRWPSWNPVRRTRRLFAAPGACRGRSGARRRPCSARRDGDPVGPHRIMAVPWGVSGCGDRPVDGEVSAAVVSGALTTADGLG